MAQLIGFGIVLTIAIVFNVYMFQLARQTWKQPAIAESRKLLAAIGTSDNPLLQAERNHEAAAALVSSYLDAGLPIGWTPGAILKVDNGEEQSVYFWACSKAGPPSQDG